MPSAKWIIFDADNTLWDVESLYDRARHEFCKYVLGKITGVGENKNSYVTPELLEQAQRHRDIQLHKTHGYSSSRFARSFEDTFTFFMPHVPAEALIHARRLAMEVFEQRATPAPGLEEVLIALSPFYQLAIITAGERWVQEKRLGDFHLRERFSELLVVERKTKEVFATFCASNSVLLEQSWVVGDSVRSDVAPAKAAGLNAIHVKAPNWSLENEVPPEGVVSVERLQEIVKIVI